MQQSQTYEHRPRVTSHWSLSSCHLYTRFDFALFYFYCLFKRYALPRRDSRGERIFTVELPDFKTLLNLVLRLVFPRYQTNKIKQNDNRRNRYLICGILGFRRINFRETYSKSRRPLLITKPKNNYTHMFWIKGAKHQAVYWLHFIAIDVTNLNTPASGEVEHSQFNGHFSYSKASKSSRNIILLEIVLQI